MLTRAALKNPYAVFALCMIALVLGAVSYKKMRVDIFPEIRIPSILVTTFYRGLSPSEMEGAITLRMEQRFVEASYVEHIESQSLAGMSYIKVFFQPEYGIDAAQSELTSLAYSIIRLLPPGVYPPSVYKFGVASLPIPSAPALSAFASKWPPHDAQSRTAAAASRFLTELDIEHAPVLLHLPGLDGVVVIDRVAAAHLA